MHPLIWMANRNSENPFINFFNLLSSNISDEQVFTCMSNLSIVGTVEPGQHGHHGDMPQCSYYRVSVLRGLSEKTSGTHVFIDIKTKQTVLRTKDCQKYVERQSIGVEDLVWINTMSLHFRWSSGTHAGWIYLNNYQTLATTQQIIRAEDDPGTAQCQRGRRLRAMTATKS